MKRSETKKLPTQAKLQEILEYCPETGRLTWRHRGDVPKEWNIKFAGKPAFAGKQSNGYLRGAIGNVSYLAHRIIWKLVNDAEPEAIDHVNGIITDNRICNLRASSFSDNVFNQLRRRNVSGVCGVYLHKASGLWHARITAKGATTSLGYFKQLADAKHAREKAKLEWGFSDRHGY